MKKFGGRCVAVFAVALVATTSASSHPTAGINITAKPPITAIVGAADPSGIYPYAVVVAATFNPEALHDDARVTFTSTKPKGVGASPFTGYDQGNVLHRTAAYQNAFAAFEGDRMLVVAHWHAYTPEVGGTVEGKKDSPLTIVQVPTREPAPRFVSEQKQHYAQQATNDYAVCAAGVIAGSIGLLGFPPLGIAAIAASAAACALGVYHHQLALDPVDPNFRVVAKPKTPPAPKVAAGKGLPAAAAAAVNKLLAVQVTEIGLTRAIVTAVNRSQGAHVKKQTRWEEKQVRAAGRYASQLASLLLAEAKLRASVRRALKTPVQVTEEQAYTFQSSLITGPLPARLASGLSRLGVTKTDQKDVRAQLIVRNHPTLYDDDPFAKLAEPLALSLLRQVAADLKAFSKRAARKPLCPPDQPLCS